MRDEFELSRRKMLAGIGALGVTSTGAGMGTTAYLNDTESFESNSLAAGELDLKVVWQEHYSDWSEDEMQAAPNARMVDDPEDVGDDEVALPVFDDPMLAVPNSDTPSEFHEFWIATSIDAYPDDGYWTESWTFVGEDDDVQDPIFSRDHYSERGYSSSEADELFRGQFADVPDFFEGEGRRPLIDLRDVKPGDFGEVTFGFHLFDNPGYVWMNGVVEDASENGTTEPEAAAEEEEDDVVELLDEIRVAIWHDDGDNVRDPNDENGIAEVVEHNKDVDGPDSDENVQLSADEALITEGTLRSVLEELSTGSGIPLDADPTTDDRDCFPNSTTRHVGFAWWLPSDVGNEIQGDSATFDLGFYTEQCRHNDGSGQQPS